MAYEHKPGTGTLFNNNKTSDSQPDIKGEFMTLDGKLIKVAGWWKDTKSGNKMLSLRQDTREPQDTNDTKAKVVAGGMTSPPMEDLPF